MDDSSRSLSSAAAAGLADSHPSCSVPHGELPAETMKHSLPSTPTKSPISASYWTSPRSRIAYSDRFIPSRAVASRLDFSVLDREAATSDATRVAAGREDLNPAYELLLRTEMLGSPHRQPHLQAAGSGGSGGCGCGAAAAMAPDVGSDAQPSQAGGSVDPLSALRMPSSPSKLFRYQSGDAMSPLGGPAPQSPFSRSPLGSEGPASPFSTSQQAARKIPRAPFKVLDAPALQDDFYLNLVDWSSQNVLAVGLSSCVYLWSAVTSKVTKLCELPHDDSVSSVSWSQRGTYLSLGTQSGKVQIWDVSRSQPVRTMEGHKGRVGTQAWSSSLLSSGSRDRTILHRDVRAPQPFVGKLTGHRSEWSPDSCLLASGGNDNHLYVWSGRENAPLCKFSDHVAAVKAIAWSPHQHGLLASGGGTTDRSIRFWNTVSGTPQGSVDTGSQVCNLVWSKNVNEIVSTHGYSQNQVVVWKYPGMTKLATLTGHSLRVLYLAVSPDGQTIVTGAGDETLRFWNVFPGAGRAGSGAGQGMESGPAVTAMSRTIIR